MLMVAGDYHPISYPGALDSGELKMGPSGKNSALPSKC